MKQARCGWPQTCFFTSQKSMAYSLFQSYSSNFTVNI